VTACPVRAGRDPEVAEILSWFAATHELVMTGFGAYWRLAWLPGPGSVGEQDALRMDGLAAARAVSQAILVEETRAHHGSVGLAAWRERLRQPRG
jgi:hypothetical protein